MAATEHPLHTPWTFYYCQRPRNTDEKAVNYEDTINKIGTFRTCEEFWRYYSHILRPDRLNAQVGLHMFREGSRAVWEDQANVNGGSFLLRLPKGYVKVLWEKLLLNMIGEQLPVDVNGAVVQTRPKLDLLYVWHRTASDVQGRLEIVQALYHALDLQRLPQVVKIEYSAFRDMMSNSNAKNTIQYIIEKNGEVVVKTPNPDGERVRS